ncbi:MAG TPA: hypothetical protein VHZ78_10340 [Rhizomicrobium sp.]|jgi:hypothetical protein|nr:hypothetical protein [Rhizomicrobium sp.]
MRFKVLVSVVPLIAGAILARVELMPGPRPCIAIGDRSVQIASMPWHADLHIAFTDDPANATVRVQVADSPEGADFAVVDDVDSAEDNACAINPATQFIAISNEPSGTAQVIYLSANGPADYRVFVKSKSFTAREAAALIVGASGGHPRLAASL